MGGRGSSSGNRARAPLSGQDERLIGMFSEALGLSADQTARWRDNARRATASSLEDAVRQSRERAATEDARRAAAELKAAKAPTKQMPIRIDLADGSYGTIHRVKPAYSAGSRTADTMYRVTVMDSDGNKRYWTNHRGAGALKKAKDDLALNLGIRGIGERMR